MQVLTIDFETYYDQEYSLRNPKLNTSQYIRDPRFLVHCCAVKFDDKPSDVLDRKQLARFFKTVKWDQTALLAHNTAFDGLILTHHYGYRPAFYYDTMSMTRGLHNEVSRASLDVIAKLYGLGGKHQGALENVKGKQELTAEEWERLAAYCARDNDLCYEIFKRQREVYPERELQLIDLTLKMFVEPLLLIDEERAKAAHKWEQHERLRTIAYAGVDENVLRSNPKFADALRKLKVDVPMKTSLKTGHETYAFAQTDPEFTELEQHDDLRVVRLIQGRLAAKSTLNETRASRFIEDGKDGQRFPVMLNYFGAKTGRWSGGNKVNCQNLPRIERDSGGNPVPNTGELRQSLLAPPGHVIVVCDSSQIEARKLAWFAGEQGLLDLFRNKEDPYCDMASTAYKKKVTKNDKQERFVGKVAVLGLGYNMGPPKFRTSLALGTMGPPVIISLAESRKIVNAYRKKNKRIVGSWLAANTVLKNMLLKKSGSFGPNDLLEYDPETVWLPNGMGLHYPGLQAKLNSHGDLCDFTYAANGGRKKIYGGLLIENIIQALARIVVAEQMLDIQHEYDRWRIKRGEVARIVLMTHDENVSVVPERLADKALDMNLRIMRTPPEWCADIPLDAEGGYAREYSK